MADPNPLTTSNLIAAAAAVLEEDGYQRASLERIGQWPHAGVRVFENDYSIVAIVIYETWSDLLSNWPNSQGALVELMSRYMTSQDAKAWEGYLVMLTPSMPGPTDQVDVNKIRYDTNRVRKLVATGDELTKLSDVERVLLPLLSLQIGIAPTVGTSILDMLPALLSKRGISEGTTNCVIKAYQEQQPLLERLHEYRNQP